MQQDAQSHLVLQLLEVVEEVLRPVGMEVVEIFTVVVTELWQALEGLLEVQGVLITTAPVEQARVLMVGLDWVGSVNKETASHHLLRILFSFR